MFTSFILLNNFDKNLKYLFLDPYLDGNNEIFFDVYAILLLWKTAAFFYFCPKILDLKAVLSSRVEMALFNYTYCAPGTEG